MDVQIIGPIASTGYGMVTAQLTHALRQEGLDVRLFPVGPMDTSWFTHEVKESVGLAVKTELEASRLPDFTLCVWHEWDHPPRMIGSFQRISGNYIAMPTFELDRVRQQALNRLSKCWRVLVSSKHCYDVLNFSGLHNVAMVPFHGVDTDIFRPIVRSKGQTMSIINVGKLEKRKGHDICLRAVAQLISEHKAVQLIAMWDTPFLPDVARLDLISKWETDAACSAGITKDRLRNHVAYVGSFNAQYMLAGTIGMADVGLYPYRAEGWNLPLLETMACGLPIVATAYSGPMQYLKQINHRPELIDAYLVGYDWVEAEDGIWFGQGNQEGKWAEPNFDDVMGGLRAFYNRWENGLLGRSAGLTEVASEFTWSKAAKRVRAWLESGCEPS